VTRSGVSRLNRFRESDILRHIFERVLAIDRSIKAQVRAFNVNFDMMRCDAVGDDD
jgi:hypothetical protein